MVWKKLPCSDAAGGNTSGTAGRKESGTEIYPTGKQFHFRIYTERKVGPLLTNTDAHKCLCMSLFLIMKNWSRSSPTLNVKWIGKWPTFT